VEVPSCDACPGVRPGLGHRCLVTTDRRPAGTRAQRVAAVLDRRLRRLPRPARVLLVFVGYLLLSVGLDAIAAHYTVADGVSLWFAPAALDVTLLMLLGLRWTPALVVAHLLQDLLISQFRFAVWQIAVLALITAASYGGAVAVLRRLHVDRRLGTLRDVVWLGVLTCLAAPLPVAVVQAVFLSGAGTVPLRQLAVAVVGFWAGSATGIGMLTPVLLIGARQLPELRPDGLHTQAQHPAPAPERSPELPLQHPGARLSKRERFGQVLLLAVAVWAAYANGGGSLDFSYVVYVPLIWIALRGGFVPSAVAVLAANIGAVALNGGQVPGEGGFALQFGLVTLTLLGVLLGAAVSQRSTDAEAHRQAALSDPLTGLGNRALLAERLAQVLERRSPAALLFLDLDRFKQVNDGLGHAAGDAVLLEVSRRLREATRAGDTVARLGGDEFAVLLQQVTAAAEVEATAARVLASVGRPVPVAGTSAHVTVSVGSASLGGRYDGADDGTEPADSAEQALQQADIALHQAKALGRDRYATYHPAMSVQAEHAQARETALSQALATGQGISVVYQPVLSLPERRVVAAEALARWTLPDGTAIAATELVSVAEQSGLIRELGRTVLTLACRDAVDWQLTGARLAINVSPFDLRDASYAGDLLAVLAGCGLPPERLELEITESYWVHDDEATAANTATLAAAGVRLVLDDFGTGYSSLRHLTQVPVSGVKIDRSFVAASPTDAQSAAVLRAVASMAGELGLEVTAEGVETDQQLAHLLDLGGCHRAQGFLLGRPVAELPGAGRRDARP